MNAIVDGVPRKFITLNDFVEWSRLRSSGHECILIFALVLFPDKAEGQQGFDGAQHKGEKVRTESSC